MAPEAWWRRAVFYRMDPARFQDGSGNGKGDLQGIVQRLDYLQSVGVDALLLEGSFDADGLEDLVREASRHHLRVVIALNPALLQGPHDTLLNTVHGWLGAGVAGVALPPAGRVTAADGGYPALAASLRQMLQSLPGERVLLSDPIPGAAISAPAPLRRRERGGATATTPGHGGQLVTAAALPVAGAGVVQLRTVLAAASAGADAETNGVLQFAADPASASPNAAADAAMLLASRGAAIFDFGDELGLDLYPAVADSSASAGKALPVMQWTPSNHTPAPTEHTEVPKPASETEYGAYHPYQPPPRSLTAGMAAPAHVAVDANIPPAPPDADTLPGFTAGTLPVAPTNGPVLNVITEDRDPRSLLNAYRQLIGLHHDNASLRNGTQTMLNRDADGALVWIRRAPAGSRTVANVVVAANLTDQPVLLTLDSDLQAAGMRPGGLRPLFAFGKEAMTGQTTTHLALPPHAVFLGEIYHGGAEPVAREVHGRHRSGHRVRR